MLSTKKSEASVEIPHIILGLAVIQAFVVFLTDTKFIPGIKNNIGPFEVNAILLIGALAIYYFRYSLPVRLHPIFAILVLWVFAATVSLFNLPSSRFGPGALHVIILLFQLILVIGLFNLLSLNLKYLLFLLRSLAISAAIVGFWVVIDQTITGSKGDSGPFRSRSHTSIYMLGAFWIVLCYLFWPNISRRERWGTFLILVPILYGILMGGRRSVYSAFIVGILCLSFSFIVIHGRQRFKLSGFVVPVVCFILLLYLNGNQYLSQLTFFQNRVGTFDDRLQSAFANEDDPELSDAFSVLQRKGALQAFTDHPILGIGWNGFYRSQYSPTGHELHSTTLRFLAELGLTGFILYLSFTALLLFRAFKLFLLVRNTPYQLPSLILLIAFCSLSVSYYYNRMFTDRVFWLLLAIFLGFEAVMLNEPKVGPVTLASPIDQTHYAIDNRLR